MRSLLHKLLFGGVVAAVLATPYASATWVYDYNTGGAADCVGVACTVTVYNSVSSDSDYGDCAGTPGSYTSCVVYQYCDAYVTGVLPTGSVTCSSGGSGTCGGQVTACDAHANGVAIVARGTCVDFYAVGTVVTPTGSATAVTANIRVCVNGNGPYQ